MKVGIDVVMCDITDATWTVRAPGLRVVGIDLTADACALTADACAAPSPEANGLSSIAFTRER